MLFLAGDIGGTKALLQLMDCQADDFSQQRLIGQQRYLCQDFDSLESIIRAFLADFNSSSQLIHSACFGLPGPVNSAIVELTNLPWVVDARQIEQACAIETVYFINDFYAAARGIETLSATEKKALYLPQEFDQAWSNSSATGRVDALSQIAKGHCLVIGAGTGLGVAPVFYDGQAYHPVSSEGGHFDFAPISETQQLLLQWLWQQWSHVSYERLLSGSGLETLYLFFQLFDCPNSYSAEFVENSHKRKKSDFDACKNTSLGSVVASTALKHAPNQSQTLSAAQVYQAAESGDVNAIKALVEFTTIYGAFVGAAALLWNAPQGIYLAGGIAAKIISWMEKPYFKHAFLEKGRMTKVVATMPVYLVLDEALGLRGAMLQNHILRDGENTQNQR